MTSDLLETSNMKHMPALYFRQAYFFFGKTPALRSAIIANTGISEEMLENPDTLIPVAAQLQQMQNLNVLIGEDFVLKAKTIWQPSSQGALDIAFRAEQTIGKGLFNLARYAKIRMPQIKFTFAEKKAGTNIQLSTDIELPLSLWRSLTEVTMLSLQAMLESMFTNFGEDIETQRIIYNWPWAPPSYVAKLDEVFYGENSFHQKKCSVFIPGEITSLKSPYYDKTLLKIALQNLEQSEQRIFKPKNHIEEIRFLLHANPPQTISAEKTAQTLSMSLRTMNRVLKDHGTSFRELRDSDLKARAEILIYKSEFSRDAIAEKLGYSDPASFNRSCRRWFGKSIKALRQSKQTD